VRFTETLRNYLLSRRLFNFGVDSNGAKRVFKGFNSVLNLRFCLCEFSLSQIVELLRLFEVKFELFGFAVPLTLLVLLPVFDALLVPLLHEASVPLQLIDLNSAHFLLTHVIRFLLLKLLFVGDLRLPFLLVVELLHVIFHVELLLGLVQRVNSHLEKVVFDLIVLGTRHCNLLRWLVVPKFTRFGEHGNVSGRVDLIQAHLELVEETQGQTTLSFHDSVHELRVKLDVQVAQGGLQTLKVLQFVRYSVLFRKFIKVSLVVKLPEQLAKEIPTCEVFLKVFYFL